MNIRFVYITAGSQDEAETIGREVVKHHLAACANIIQRIKSFYWWDGKVQSDTEAILIVKTRQDLVDKLIDMVKTLHSYDCPCIVSLPVLEGNPDFLKWVQDETIPD